MKQKYEAPEVQVIEMEVQGMIAASTDGLTLPGYGAGTVPEP
jgi:hypothetical protein